MRCLWTTQRKVLTVTTQKNYTQEVCLPPQVSPLAQDCQSLIFFQTAFLKGNWRLFLHQSSVKSSTSHSLSKLSLLPEGWILSDAQSFLSSNSHASITLPYHVMPTTPLHTPLTCSKLEQLFQSWLGSALFKIIFQSWLVWASFKKPCSFFHEKWQHIRLCYFSFKSLKDFLLLIPKTCPP